MGEVHGRHAIFLLFHMDREESICRALKRDARFEGVRKRQDRAIRGLERKIEKRDIVIGIFDSCGRHFQNQIAIIGGRWIDHETTLIRSDTTCGARRHFIKKHSATIGLHHVINRFPAFRGHIGFPLYEIRADE